MAERTGLVQRFVEPEILDGLPADDRRAARARRDLRLLNALTLQDRIVARAIAKHGAGLDIRRIADLGAGDGAFMLRVARRLGSSWRGTEVFLVDRADCVARETREAFAAMGSHVEVAAQDVFAFLEQAPSCDLIVANLFLHHLQDAELARLFALAARTTRLLVAGEMRRVRLVRELARFMGRVGGGDVTSQDGVTSARAAFLGKELSALWPRGAAWETREREVGLWTHLFVAKRVA